MSTTHLMPRQAFPQGDGYPRSPSPVHPVPDLKAREDAERLAKFLGWFSVGLGVTALASPEGLARMIGARGDRTDRTILRLVGLQELAAGVGILSKRRPTGWLWARVAGDALHLSMLGSALATGPRRADRMAAATAAVLGITALDLYDAVALGQRAGAGGSAATSWRGGPVDVHGAITISRPAEELYSFWRNFENLPKIMTHLESVKVQEGGKSHWVAKAPAGMTVAWDAEVTEDVPNERIAWRSLDGQVDTSGSVRFVPAPAGRGTEVHVELRYNPPGGSLGKLAARLFGESPIQQVNDDLRHFKQVMEVGEVVLSEGTSHGSALVEHPAHPPA